MCNTMWEAQQQAADMAAPEAQRKKGSTDHGLWLSKVTTAKKMHTQISTVRPNDCKQSESQ